jgi:hypothetical protein
MFPSDLIILLDIYIYFFLNNHLLDFTLYNNTEKKRFFIQDQQNSLHFHLPYKYFQPRIYEKTFFFRN